MFRGKKLKINKRIKNKTLLGLYFILFGVLLLIKIIVGEAVNIAYFMLIFSSLIGIQLLLNSLLNKSKNGFLFLWGMNIFCISVFLFVLVIGKYSFAKLWPLIPIFSGISFILYGVLIDSKNKGVYISGLFITFISLVLFFYSFTNCFDFEKFLLILITGSIIFIGVYLVRSSIRENGDREKKWENDRINTKNS